MHFVFGFKSTPRASVISFVAVETKVKKGRDFDRRFTRTWYDLWELVSQFAASGVCCLYSLTFHGLIDVMNVTSCRLFLYPHVLEMPSLSEH